MARVRRATFLLLLLLSATPASAWENYTSGNAFFESGSARSHIADVASFPDGSVVIAGAIEDPPTGMFFVAELDWFVSRIDVDGNVQWAIQLESGVDSDDRAQRVAIDGDGNVFVGGQMWNTSAGAYQARLVKLDGTTGNTLTSTFFASGISAEYPYFVPDLAVDAAGNPVIVAGTGFHVMKLHGDDLTQPPIWTSAGAGNFDVEILPSGDILIAGTVSNAQVAKLDGDDGTAIWTNNTLPVVISHGAKCDPPAGGQIACGSAAATTLLAASDGDAIVLTQQVGGDAVVTRLQGADGAVDWSESVVDLRGHSIAADASTVYVAGGGGASHDQFAIAALNIVTGSVSWSETYGLGAAKDIDITGEGNPAAVGPLNDPVYGGAYLLYVLAAEPADGTETWRVFLSGTGDGLAIAQTADSNLVAGGMNVRVYYYNEMPIYGAYATAAKLLSGNGSLFECGNGVLENGEMCDDHNTANGDCCSSTCLRDPVDTPCDDGLACSTTDLCNASGTCEPRAGDCCGDGTVQFTMGEQCDAAVSCCISCQVDVGAPCYYGFHGSCNPLPGVCDPRARCIDGPSICSCCTAHGGSGCSDTECEDCVTGYQAGCAGNWDGCVYYAYNQCASACGCSCGNGSVNFGEQCDDGNTTSGDCCTSKCQLEGCACGNGSVESGEQCDDGNTTSGDCCSSTCQLEGCVCGNGSVNVGEQCDDGNLTSGDCCSSTCQLEGCACGNGSVESGEQCDDGNATSGDCCSSACHLEGCACGNASVENGEQCDDGNTTSGDCCSSTCHFEGVGSPGTELEFAL